MKTPALQVMTVRMPNAVQLLDSKINDMLTWENKFFARNPNRLEETWLLRTELAYKRD